MCKQCVPGVSPPPSQTPGYEANPKGADSMAVSGLRFENALVGSEWVTAVLLCTNGLRKQSSCPAQHPFLMGKLSSRSGRGDFWFWAQFLWKSVKYRDTQVAINPFIYVYSPK